MCSFAAAWTKKPLIIVSSTVAFVACSSAPPTDQSSDRGPGSGGSLATVTGGSSNVDPVESSGGSPVTGTGGEPSEDGKSTWTLVWADEFEGSGLPDPAMWTSEEQPPGWVNNELQHYAKDRVENLRQEDGSLIIEARRDYFQGQEYSSARVHTHGHAEFTSGRFEIRAKLPPGRGTWAALWMMPSDIFKYATKCSASTGWVDGCDAWPNSGEIDIMEHVGHVPGEVHATIHSQRYNWMSVDQVTTSTMVADVFDTFHIYAMERDAEEIRIYVDDVLYFRYKNPGEGWPSWPFDQPFYFIFNIAIGGSWGGAQGVDPAAFPTKMYVDYVRAYEKTE